MPKNDDEAAVELMKRLFELPDSEMPTCMSEVPVELMNVFELQFEPRSSPLLELEVPVEFAIVLEDEPKKRRMP